MKVGDKVRVITEYNLYADISEHGYKKGQIITIEHIEEEDEFPYDTGIWWVRESDIEPLKDKSNKLFYLMLVMGVIFFLSLSITVLNIFAHYTFNMELNGIVILLTLTSGLMLAFLPDND